MNEKEFDVYKELTAVIHAYEGMGVDHLQRETMKKAADLIKEQAITLEIQGSLLRHLRELADGYDIPHPTTPEYREHHEQIKTIVEFIDQMIKRIGDRPVFRFKPEKGDPS
jgi:hypothetical protein